jgi:hypothetical protein
MMDDVRWETFEGTNFTVGRQLGRYWVRRLNACRKRCLVKTYRELLRETKWTKDYEYLYQTIRCEFPFLVRELEGMVKGTIDAGWKASFTSMFALSLGETDNYVLGCSTIAHHDAYEMILAHNEEYDPPDPLCYARVRLQGTSSF